MSRAYAMTRTLPFAMPTSVGRRIEVAAKRSWAIMFIMGAVLCMGYQVFLMNSTAGKGYTLRNLERQLEQLNGTVATLENRSAQLQALHTIEAKVEGAGYVAVDHMEFVDVAGGSYALAR
ncbi:hypothetical protein IT087_00170 [Candidatus Uhrbacteria bacterium]|nr:hypothetical protein [Candidatus Uhrbacteria bacterium]